MLELASSLSHPNCEQRESNKYRGHAQWLPVFRVCLQEARKQVVGRPRVRVPKRWKHLTKRVIPTYQGPLWGLVKDMVHNNAIPPPLRFQVMIGEHHRWAKENVLVVECGFQAGDPELAACPTTVEEEASSLTILIMGEVVDITAHCK